MFWKKWVRKSAKLELEAIPAKKSASDRRRDPRLSEERDIMMEVIAPEAGATPLAAKTLDISVGGVRLESAADVQPESLVRLHLPSDQLGKWIQLTGKIRWVKKAEEEKVVEIGLEFVDVPPETVLDLMEHIYRRPS